MAFDSGSFGSGIGGFLGGLFGHSKRPYQQGINEYQGWAQKALDAQQPYSEAGKGAIGNYQQWLQGQQDPTDFINHLMSGYQESPYAHYMQQQSMRAGENAASASGLMGSTPLMQQLEQNAHDISSQDQSQWLQNVLGINSQYGQGQQNIMNAGQGSANALSSLLDQIGQNRGQAAYGMAAGKHQDWNNMLGGLGSMIGSFLPHGGL